MEAYMYCEVCAHFPSTPKEQLLLIMLYVEKAVHGLPRATLTPLMRS